MNFEASSFSAKMFSFFPSMSCFRSFSNSTRRFVSTSLSLSIVLSSWAAKVERSRTFRPIR